MQKYIPLLFALALAITFLPTRAIAQPCHGCAPSVRTVTVVRTTTVTSCTTAATPKASLCTNSAACSTRTVSVGCSSGRVGLLATIAANYHARQAARHERIADRHAARAGAVVVIQATPQAPMVEALPAPKKQ